MQPVEEDDGETRPWLVPFSEDAWCLLDEFRLAARAWEAGTDGLLLSFIGKLSGRRTGHCRRREPRGMVEDER
jgi:hypothetical protein